jgi:two-component system, OmpR family, sensor kinase
MIVGTGSLGTSRPGHQPCRLARSSSAPGDGGPFLDRPLSSSGAAAPTAPPVGLMAKAVGTSDDTRRSDLKSIRLPAGLHPEDSRSPPEARQADVGRRRWIRLPTVRSRLVASYLLLALTGALTTLATREILVFRLNDRMDAAMRQEVLELERLVEDGRDPVTAEPFASVRRVFDVYFNRNVPSHEEALLAFVDGGLYRSALARFPIERFPASAVDHWVRLSARNGSADRLSGRFQTAVGEAYYRAVQVTVPRRPLGEPDQGGEIGAFIVAELPSGELAGIRELQLYGAGVTFVVALLTAACAWFLAGRVLSPVRQLTETARSISESDLTRRLQVKGTDEAAEMARSFNGMLDRLESVYRWQREFLRAAGHELRTPLTVATGYLGVLGPSVREQRDTIPVVLDELGRMGRIVDDLQALAEAEHPDYLMPQTLDIQKFAHELMAKASALGDREWRLDRVDEGTMGADPDRLTEAVLNLADNAVKNTTPGDTIGLGIVVRRDEVMISVRDSGIGVPEADRDRLFEPFVRGPGVGQRYRGAGLGLAIVKTVAEAHGGWVTLDSEPGRGSRFTIVLPRGRGPWPES